MFAKASPNNSFAFIPGRSEFRKKSVFIGANLRITLFFSGYRYLHDCVSGQY